MPEIFEVAVIGAGMFGSAAAKHLSRSGARVAVIGPVEPAARTAMNQYSVGAYFDEARITRRMGWDEVWGATDARSLERFADIEAESGIEFFHETGSLVLMARSIGHRTGAILQQCAADGIDVARLPAAALRAEFPELGLPPMSGGVEGLLERTRAGYLNPRKLVSAQLSLAVAAGARLIRSAVTGVHRGPNSRLWELRLDDDTPGTSVLRAARVLVATGALTNHNGVLPSGQQLALHAFTEPNLLFELGDRQLERLRRLPTVVTVDPEDTGNANLSLYLLPPIRYPDGKWYMRIGPGMQPIVQELRTADEIVDWYAGQQITPQQEAFLTTMMHMLVPDLKPMSVHPSTCIIEKTPSRYPYLGHLDDDTFTVAVGGNGHGARGSDEIGRLAAGLVLGEPWDFPIPQSVFRPLAASADATGGEERPSFLKPPFGLC